VGAGEGDGMGNGRLRIKNGRCDNEGMQEAQISVGFPEMWQPVFSKYRPFFDCAAQLAQIVTEITKRPVGGPLLNVAGRMAAAASNTAGAIVLLALNGYGHDALKLARSVFEIQVNIAWFRLHPEQIDDYTEYHHIQQKRYYDMFTDEQKARFPQERYEEMMMAYTSALPRFTSTRNPAEPRNEWCAVSLYKRAKDVDRLRLYRLFYGPASSVDHLDFSGLAAYSDEDQLADMAPSWNHLGTALSGIGCAYRAVFIYDEMAQLEFRQRLEEGPGATYTLACKETPAEEQSSLWIPQTHPILQPATTTRKVYKFLSAEHAIEGLQRRRLKIARIDGLNDPFDLASIDITDDRIRHALDALITDIRPRMGLLCFSRNWDNLLMWSHYAAAHTGVCLAFDIRADKNHDLDVHYQPNVWKIRRREDVNLDLVTRLLHTKHESWSYEQEVRSFVGLNDPPDEKGRHWKDFDDNLQLRAVIIGAQCAPSVSRTVFQAAEAFGDSVKCYWAGMRPDAFLLVLQDQPPDWHATVSA
jgi:hypothetical protein